MPAMHRFDRVWKGYCAAIVFMEPTRKWRPWCLEITENMELDMRLLFARGTEWQLVRDPATKGGVSSIQAVYQRRLDEDQVPPEFDYLACVKALYHRAEIDLSHANPQSPRLIMEEMEGDVPEALASKINAEDRARKEYEERMNKLNEQTKKRAAEFRERFGK